MALSPHAYNDDDLDNDDDDDRSVCVDNGDSTRGVHKRWPSSCGLLQHQQIGHQLLLD